MRHLDSYKWCGIVKTFTSFIYDNGTQSFDTKHVHSFENNPGNSFMQNK